MKKILILIMLIFSFILFSCGGGGGGAAGASIPDSEYTTHNPHGWGGGSGSGSGSGGNGGSNNGTIMGGTPLTVTGYTYNGQTYTSVEELRNAIAENAPEGQFTIPFTCTVAGGGSETRTARITKTVSGNDTEILIEHQYKATFPDGAGTQEVSYYMNDGIVLPGDPAGTNINDFIFETNWNIGGTLYPCGSSISVASSGDMDFSTATTEMAPYGFKEEVQGSGEYILGFSSTATGNIAINTNKVIKQVDLTSGSSMNLDFTGVTFKNNMINSSFFTGTASNLAGITLPSGLTAIGNGTFLTGYSNLETVVIPGSVTSIGDLAFKTCDALENITILGSGLQTIGDSAFYSCSSLQAFEMPNSVTTLGESAFYGCSNLATLTLSNQLTEIPNNAFYGCSSLDSTLDIPASVTAIGNSAFQDCSSIDTLTLHSGLTAIGNNAFQGCSDLDAVSIPNGVTTIGTAAFLSCSDLAQISIPSSVNSIGNSAFNGVKADCDLTINNNGTPITLGGPLALPNSNYKVRLTGTNIPKKNVSDSIFDSDTNLTDVSITGSMTAISDFAFYGCTNLKNVELPSGIATIGDDAFCNCTKLETINIPATVTQIKDEAFKNAGQSAAHTLEITFASNQNMTQCHLPDKDFNVVLEGGVPIWNGDSIFKDEQTLKSVVYAGGSNLMANAFTGCSSLTTVTFQSYPTAIQTTPLPDNVHNIIIGLGQVPIENVKDVGNLFPSTMNYSSLTVTFYNDPSKPGIRINEGAFNFTGANLITYTFVAHPNVNMTYDNGDCFPSGKTTVFSSTNFTWNAANKTWQ